MSTYSYKNPKFINSPKGVVEVVEVIYDGKDDPPIHWLLLNGKIPIN